MIYLKFLFPFFFFFLFLVGFLPLSFTLYFVVYFLYSKSECRDTKKKKKLKDLPLPGPIKRVRVYCVDEPLAYKEIDIWTVVIMEMILRFIMIILYYMIYCISHKVSVKYYTHESWWSTYMKKSADPLQVEGIFIGEIKELIHIEADVRVLIIIVTSTSRCIFFPHFFLGILHYYYRWSDLSNFVAFSWWRSTLFLYLPYFLAQMRIPIVLDFVICSSW